MGEIVLGLEQVDLADPEILLACEGDQVATYLAPCVSGEKRELFALTEPEAGSNVARLKTEAVPVTDDSDVVVPSSVLSITKTNNGPGPNGTGGWTDADGSGDVSVGDTITYSYTVTNTGTANFTDVTLSDDQLGKVPSTLRGPPYSPSSTDFCFSTLTQKQI